MDTRFWGPSGWSMLHLITFDYKYSAESAILYAKFFETIPYILPCKFCRSSLTDYYKQYPYTASSLTNDYMNPQLNIRKWMYNIHNCVNDKLKSQGLPISPKPSFASVVKRYESMLQRPWEAQLATFWDFLFSVAYHYPKYIKVEPMPDCPSTIENSDACELNKWNVLPVKERMKWYVRFWSLLPDILPSEIGQRWRQIHLKPNFHSRKTMLEWLWSIRCALDPHFKDPYTAICKRIKSYSSDCGRSTRAITCRRITKKKKH